MSDRNPVELPASADVEAIAALDPPPRSVEHARARPGWRKERATVAVRAWRTNADLERAEPRSGGSGEFDA